MQLRAVDVVIRTKAELRVRESDGARALPHPTAMYTAAEKCVEALEVHRVGWGDSGVGTCTLEDCYGA